MMQTEEHLDTKDMPVERLVVLQKPLNACHLQQLLNIQLFIINYNLTTLVLFIFAKYLFLGSMVSTLKRINRKDYYGIFEDILY